MAVQPILYVQEYVTGTQLDGSAPDGTVASSVNGRVRHYMGCTVGGLFAFPEAQYPAGVSIYTWYVNVSGTAFEIRVVEPDGYYYVVGPTSSYSLGSSNAASLGDAALLVPPGWHVEVHSDDPVSQDSRIGILVGAGIPNFGLTKIIVS